jgi:DNA-directed RNA polymerase subunit RPC12/RpoP
MTTNETCIVQCKKCGLLTRHERQRWERRSLLLLLFGRTETVEGWVCTQCGRRRIVKRVDGDNL